MAYFKTVVKGSLLSRPCPASHYLLILVTFRFVATVGVYKCNKLLTLLTSLLLSLGFV